MNIVVVAAAILIFTVVFIATVVIAYKNIIKNKKTYSRKKAFNGDIYLDDVCDRYLNLTNVHIPNEHN